jgi:hypothetical protein
MEYPKYECVCGRPTLLDDSDVPRCTKSGEHPENCEAESVDSFRADALVPEVPR